MNFTEKHFIKIKDCIEHLDSEAVSLWFLNKWYYPEWYVLPPCFSSEEFSLRNTRIVNDSEKATQVKSISFPKTDLSVRQFGVTDPRYFHDCIFTIKENWNDIKNHLFSWDNKIYSYSFPIPLDFNDPWQIEKSRSDRMIYEYIEMAEKDLIADAYNYEYVVHSDIKNFYPSIYTHTLSWAFNWREWSRDNRWPRNKSFTNRLDHLLQYSNDGCTNGIPIWSALSDLISELILVKVDKNISEYLIWKGVDFHGVRFKDDYRILVKNKEDWKKIIDCIQEKLSEYHLQIHEDKTSIKQLPEWLYREHIMKYEQYSFKRRSANLSFREFEKVYYEVLKIDTEVPNKWVIDKFLWELVLNSTSIKIDFWSVEKSDKNIVKFISLLWKMYNRRPKILPNILWIFEILFEHSEIWKECILDLINQKVIQTCSVTTKKDFFFLCWSYYFFRTNSINTSNFTDDASNPFWNSIFNNRDLVYNSPDFVAFRNIDECKARFWNINLNIVLFQKKDESSNALDWIDDDIPPF